MSQPLTDTNNTQSPLKPRNASNNRGTAPFIAMIFLVFAYCGFHVVAVVDYVAKLRETTPGFPLFAGLYPSPFIALAMIGIRKWFTFALKPRGYSLIPSEKWSREEYEKRVDRFCHVVFKFLYFLVSTFVGYMILKDQPWMPSSMGGSGKVSNCWSHWPHQKMTQSIHWYYVVSLGYHLQSLLYQLGSSRRNDFWEMFLHHSCTLFLIVFSYITNLYRFGTLVFWLHDCGDVSSYLVKAFVDTRYTKATLAAYISILSTWGYLRLFVFPFQVIRSAVQDAPFEIPGVTMMTVLMSILAFLHVYWYTLFIRMGIAFLQTGKTEDVIEDISTDHELEVIKRNHLATTTSSSSGPSRSKRKP